MRRILLEEDWTGDDGRTDPDAWTGRVLVASAAALRADAEQRLHRLLDTFAASLRYRDVARLRFGDAEGDIDRGGVDAYVTGGSCVDCPLRAYEAWDIVFDIDRLPAGWCDRIRAACGLLHPHGDGPAAAVVTFHTWAAPARGEVGNP